MRPAALTLLFIVPVIAAADGHLQVRARYPRGPRGTMHLAEEITVSAPSARPLTLKGSFLPIPGPAFELPGSRYVLLGWSSTGAGMQSIHVFLLGVQDAALHRLASLVYQTDRAHSGLLLRHAPDGSVLLGLPEPPAGSLHDESEWSLTITPGEPPRSLPEIRRLTYEAISPVGSDLFSTPPTEASWRPGRVSWIAVTPTSFSPGTSRGH